MALADPLAGNVDMRVEPSWGSRSCLCLAFFVAGGKFVYHYRNYLLRLAMRRQRERERQRERQRQPLLVVAAINVNSLAQSGQQISLLVPAIAQQNNRKKKRREKQCHTTVMRQVSV